jgi:hypothetical protein
LSGISAGEAPLRTTITAHSGGIDVRAPHEERASCMQGILPRLRPRIQDKMARRPRIGVAGVLALAVGASLSACSSMSDNPFTPFADPGTYAFHNCEQIAGLQASFRTREQELRMLMDKAEQSTGGAIVNVIAYQAEYAKARDELKVLEATARSKNCKPKQ